MEPFYLDEEGSSSLEVMPDTIVVTFLRETHSRSYLLLVQNYEDRDLHFVAFVLL